MDVEILPLDEIDLDAADKIFRTAFGTFLGFDDPSSFRGDSAYVHHRRRAYPGAALGAYSDGKLVGSNFATNWGGFGFLGPLTVDPSHWEQGIAQKLLDATMELFDKWGSTQVALFTFPNSPKHIGLYQKFDFWPQHLTPIMSKPVASKIEELPYLSFMDLDGSARVNILRECLSLTEDILPGLDVSSEIRAVDKQKLGDTIFIQDRQELVGFAICHTGVATEAGSDTLYIKFGAVRPGFGAAKNFERLLSICELLATKRSMKTIVAGTNMGRHEAYHNMLEMGFRILMTGVAMQRFNFVGYNRPNCFVVDDWR